MRAEGVAAEVSTLRHRLSRVASSVSRLVTSAARGHVLVNWIRSVTEPTGGGQTGLPASPTEADPEMLKALDAWLGEKQADEDCTSASRRWDKRGKS